jgi:methyl-accepting chemotaxis protein
MKIGTKLVGGFLTVALIAAAIGAVGYIGLNTVGGRLNQVAQTRMPAAMSLLQVSDAQNSIVVGERGLVNSRMLEPGVRRAQYAYIDDHWKEADEAARIYEGLPHSTAEGAAWNEFRAAWNRWKEGHATVRALSEKRDQMAASGSASGSPEIALLDDQTFAACMSARTDFLDCQKKLGELVATNRAEAGAAASGAAAATRRSALLMIFFTLAGAAAAVFLGTILSRNITLPLRRGMEMMRELGKGHLEMRLGMSRRDEIGILASTMDEFAEDLQTQVVNNMRRIAAGDLDVNIRIRDGQDEIGPALQKTVDCLQGLVTEMNTLGMAAVEGTLSTRGNSGRFEGAYRDIVEGVNLTLDAIITPVNEAAETLEKLAQRDMTARMTGDYSGDHARIKDALNQAADNLDQSLQQVTLAVEQVASASAQIGTGSQTLAQGASEQASFLEEVSSSLQEMAAMTRQNAGNAKEARGLSEGARSSANQGLDSMRRLSEAMEKIKASSDSTARIVKTIDEIAFQTNLLALNAAVEAARAGDAGKGFAVVAEEVRNLAMRSAEAAKNTANMIEESVHNAESGVQLNQEVLAKLQQINEQSNKVGEVMNEIAAASDQQTTGIDQVTAAMEQMNQVTQQNAASSEESASAAEELSGQAQELHTMVARFHLSESSAASTRAWGPASSEWREAA